MQIQSTKLDHKSCTTEEDLPELWGNWSGTPSEISDESSTPGQGRVAALESGQRFPSEPPLSEGDEGEDDKVPSEGEKGEGRDVRKFFKADPEDGGSRGSGRNEKAAKGSRSGGGREPVREAGPRVPDSDDIGDGGDIKSDRELVVSESASTMDPSIQVAGDLSSSGVRDVGGKNVPRATRGNRGDGAGAGRRRTEGRKMEDALMPTELEMSIERDLKEGPFV